MLSRASFCALRAGVARLETRRGEGDRFDAARDRAFAAGLRALGRRRASVFGVAPDFARAFLLAAMSRPLLGRGGIGGLGAAALRLAHQAGYGMRTLGFQPVVFAEFGPRCLDHRLARYPVTVHHRLIGIVAVVA